MSTVCAIATPAAVGGISVIRISGEKTEEIAAKVFKPVSGIPVSEIKGYHAAYGEIFDGKELIDDGILLMFRAPHSYTGEDAAEISCHGGLYVTKRVLSACVNAGAEPAAAGEFTKRALLNGKMSLTQAEAVADIISAEGERFLNASNAQKKGALYRRTEKISEDIKAVSSQIAAWIDFPDDDTPAVTSVWLEERLSSIKEDFDKLLKSSEICGVIRDGISCAIVGKPNVGKSTIMNLLSGKRRSIVSNIAGTTRDIVEDAVSIDGVRLKLADCAGIRSTSDEIEKIGVEIMLERLNESDIILAVFDGSKGLEPEDRELMERLEGKNVLCIVNKSDLERRVSFSDLQNAFGKVIYICAKDENSIGKISEALKSSFNLESADAHSGIIANERQLVCAKKAASAIDKALEGVRMGISPDAVGVMLDEALSAVYELSGKNVGEEVIAEVFGRFCVGK